MGEIPKQPIIGPTYRRSAYLARAPIWSVNSKVEQAAALDWSVSAPT